MKKIFCICIATVLLVPWCRATDELYDALEVSKVISASPAADDVKYIENPSFSAGVSDVVSKMFDGIKSFLSQGVRCVAVICAVSFLTSSVEAFSPLGDSGAVRTSLSLVGAIAVTATASGSFSSVMGMGKEFISGIEDFSKVLLPTVAAAEATCGSAGAATVKAAITLLFSDILITVINRALVPLVYINIFAATANAAAKNNVLQKISEFSSKTISVTLKVILGAFVSYVGISGIVAGSVDKAGLKVAQFAIGAAVPIVGGAVSEATETVVAGAAMIKNSVGVFGMLSILSAFAMPFALMLVNYLSFKAASLISSPVISGGVAELSAKLAESFGLIIAMCATVATVIIIAIIAAMRSVGVL